MIEFLRLSIQFVIGLDSIRETPEGYGVKRSVASRMLSFSLDTRVQLLTLLS